jgi:hypothetical protein
VIIIIAACVFLAFAALATYNFVDSVRIKSLQGLKSHNFIVACAGFMSLGLAIALLVG